MSATKKKEKMRKTTIEITEKQYFFLKEKALEFQKQRKNYSIVSIIRECIERYMQQSQEHKGDISDDK